MSEASPHILSREQRRARAQAAQRTSPTTPEAVSEEAQRAQHPAQRLLYLLESESAISEIQKIASELDAPFAGSPHINVIHAALSMIGANLPYNPHPATFLGMMQLMGLQYVSAKRYPKPGFIAVFGDIYAPTSVAIITKLPPDILKEEGELQHFNGVDGCLIMKDLATREYKHRRPYRVAVPERRLLYFLRFPPPTGCKTCR